MKKLLVLTTISLALVGCKSGYDITLTNGTRYTGISKPVLDKKTDSYKFTAGGGQEMKVPASRVRLIEPHTDTPDGPFNFAPKKK